MISLVIIEASTSGHTSFVLDEVVKNLTLLSSEITITRVRAEKATEKNFTSADAILLGSGTWNTGGVEGQLNPYMHELLFVRLKGSSIKKPMAFISLGDDRYYFTTRCTEHFLKFQRNTGGLPLIMPLIIVNEPYDQTEKIRIWSEKLVVSISSKCSNPQS